MRTKLTTPIMSEVKVKYHILQQIHLQLAAGCKLLKKSVYFYVPFSLCQIIQKSKVGSRFLPYKIQMST